MEDAERILQIYSGRVPHVGPSCCLLARRMWSGKRLPLIRGWQPTVSVPHLHTEQDHLQGGRWSWGTRSHCQLQMDSQMERKDVLKVWVKHSFKNQGVSQKDPWWDTFTGLVPCWGVIRGRMWRVMCWKIPWNLCGSGGCFWEPARSLQKHDRWFLESERKPTHRNSCCLPPHQRDGWSGCAGDGAACQAGSHPLHPVSAPSSPTKVWFSTQVPAARLLKRISGLWPNVTSHGAVCSAIQFQEDKRDEGSQFSPGNSSCHPCW